MIDISKLIYGQETSGDELRYVEGVHKRPVVVWNSTKTCNLKCIHCYSESTAEKYSGELTTSEAKNMIDDLSRFNVPVLLFSGGEPFLRKDLQELIDYTVSKNIRAVISTNGTLISKETAKWLKDARVAYVGISLDGIGDINDEFRGKKGAFKMARDGFNNCVEAGVKVGLRLTLTKHNHENLPGIFDFIEKEKINRACFYHLVYSGRGSDIIKEDLTHEQTRKSVDYIIERTAKLKNVHILTVDNHTDGVYIYKKLKGADPDRARKVYDLLKINGGNSSGSGIACVDNTGNVFADQFWKSRSFGNVHKRKFSDIWQDSSDSIMAGLKNRKHLLKGKCAKCDYVDICNGNFRARAEAVYGDPWQEDPACYLTKEEVSS